MSRGDILAAGVAEYYLDGNFRHAVDEAFEQSTDHGVFLDTKNLLQEVVFRAFSAHRGKRDALRAWEIRRLYAIESLRENHDVDTRLFGKFVTSLGGLGITTELTVDDLPEGNRNVIKTNEILKASNRLLNDPGDYLADAVAIISNREKRDRSFIGPENYATGLKFFADKVSDTSWDELAQSKENAINIQKMFDGFFTVVIKDKPNFIELTNILYVIRMLPEGMLDRKHTRVLLEIILEQLPSLNRRALNVMIRALAKIDFCEYGEQAAIIMDLAIRQRGEIEKSEEMLSSLKVIAKVPNGEASASAFKALCERSSELEKESMDFADLDYVNACLRKISEVNDDDLEVVKQAQETAFTVAKRAVRLLMEKKGTTTTETFRTLQEITKRIADNYKSIC